jgi:hypothetical protein
MGKFILYRMMEDNIKEIGKKVNKMEKEFT